MNFAVVLQWFPLLVALVLLFAKSLLPMINIIGWGTLDTSHGPLILAICAWMFWINRSALVSAQPQPRSPMGWSLLLCGLGAYMVGYSQEFFALLGVSWVLVVAGVIRLTLGRQALWRLSFPVLMLLLAVPLPATTIDPLLIPVKVAVSNLVGGFLYWLGYPVLNFGVILYVDKYQLQVADACSGMNTFISLLGIGLLYVYMFKERTAKNYLFFSVLAPLVAFFSNAVRIAALVLVTFYFGEDAGKSIHDYAGVIEVMLAYVLLYAVDMIAIRVRALAQALRLRHAAPSQKA